jgi:hypothetical protein
MDRLTSALLILMGWSLLVVITLDYRVVQGMQESGTFDGRQTTNAEKQKMIDIHNHSLLAAYVDLGVIRTANMTPDSIRQKLSMNTRLLHTWPSGDVAYRQSVLLAISGRTDDACRMFHLASAAYPAGRDITLDQLNSLKLGMPKLDGFIQCASRQ